LRRTVYHDLIAQQANLGVALDIDGLYSRSSGLVATSPDASGLSMYGLAGLIARGEFLSHLRHLRPTLQLQSCDALELLTVVRHEREAAGERLSRDEQIVRANGWPCRSKSARIRAAASAAARSNGSSMMAETNRSTFCRSLAGSWAFSTP